MRILATNNFSNKLYNYTDNSVKDKILTLFKQIEESKSLLNLINQSNLTLENVYVYKIQDYRLFFTLEKDDVLFVDIIKKESQKINLSIKNPNYNTHINPKFNTSINPNYNTSINPQYNTSINPQYNTAINPNYNTSINPQYNTSINPQYNTTINPQYNNSINPKYNSSINPSMNPSFNGLFIFDLNDVFDYYIIQANDTIFLIYDLNNELISFGVKRETGYSIFNFKTSTYSSFLSSDGQNGFNHFDLTGNWIGYVK